MLNKQLLKNKNLRKKFYYTNCLSVKTLKRGRSRKISSQTRKTFKAIFDPKNKYIFSVQYALEQFKNVEIINQ